MPAQGYGGTHNGDKLVRASARTSAKRSMSAGSEPATGHREGCWATGGC